MTHKAILIAHCGDKVGLVSAISTWLKNHDGNILELDQHVDAEAEHFFIRVVWDLDGFPLGIDAMRSQFEDEVARGFNMNWSIESSQQPLRIALFVSKLGHCLWDLLARHQSKEWNAELPIIVSNHETHRDPVEKLGYTFHHIPVTKDTKVQDEARQIALLKEHKIDLVVLARYMQILSPDFVSHYSGRIINIHHSFLPAFAGAKPYHRAYERGVKIIGATAHYVTADLDEGPIIDQETIRVSHRDSIDDLVRTGRDLEKIVLSRAIFLHLQRRVAVHGNRTIVFS